MQIRRFNEEVVFVNDGIVKVGRYDIEDLKSKACANLRKRIRLCVHRSTEDNLHEMFIVHTKGMYVRPHKHLNKSESFHVIKGSADVVLFNEEGDIAEVIHMADYSSGGIFYYRISEPYYHSLITRSDAFIFHETTKGPFNKTDTIFAPWSPEENDAIMKEKFMRNLMRSVDSFILNSGGVK